MEQLTKIGSITILKYLHKGCWYAKIELEAIKPYQPIDLMIHVNKY